MKSRSNTPTKVSKNRNGRTSGLPIPWAEIPHDDLWKQALDAMGLGSRARSTEDSLRHVLKRRLPRLDSRDHVKYVQLECCRMVETLRVLRDQYRNYLKSEGCKPIVEMYWVVFRFAIIPYAVKLLRSTAADYITNSKVREDDWQKLFGLWDATVLPPPETNPFFTANNSGQKSMTQTISELVGEEVFDELVIGGPFGRDEQLHIGQALPSFALRMGELSLMETIELRQEWWEQCRPWSEGLATLFDVLQEELFLQSEALPEDGRRAQSIFLSLTKFEKIAYQYIIGTGRERTARMGEHLWKNLLCELDNQGILLDDELKGKAKQVLNAVRKKGRKIDTWSQCYDPKLCTSREFGKTYSLRREVTHSLHNTAKKAAYQFGKVWKM